MNRTCAREGQISWWDFDWCFLIRFCFAIDKDRAATLSIGPRLLFISAWSRPGHVLFAWYVCLSRFQITYTNSLGYPIRIPSCSTVKAYVFICSGLPGFYVLSLSWCIQSSNKSRRWTRMNEKEQFHLLQCRKLAVKCLDDTSTTLAEQPTSV
jgi:hypothetical protein